MLDSNGCAEIPDRWAVRHVVEPQPEENPPLLFLSAVLGRAMLDLQPHLPCGLRRKAIFWFEDYEAPTDWSYVSFNLVRLYVPLSGKRMAQIHTLLDVAKRETEGVTDSMFITAPGKAGQTNWRIG